MNGKLYAAPALLLAGLAFAASSAESRVKEDAKASVELEEARVFVEWNSTANDFGIHFFWDGEPWKEMKVRGADGRVLLQVDPRRNLRLHGLTEGFFESAEPSADELSMEEFFERFPAGEFEFEGRTLEGDELEGEAEFSHVLPAPPTGLSPGTGAVVSRNGFTASFSAVTHDTEGNAIDVAYYELVVEKSVEDPILQTFTVILRPGVTSIQVPASFLEANTQYKLEVLAVLEGGNRTISETGGFTTD